MGIRDRQNGPTFGKPTYKAGRRPHNSLEKQKVEREQTVASCAKSKAYNQLPQPARIAFLVDLAKKAGA